jgi:xanthine dehydrogenase accessory factor
VTNALQLHLEMVRAGRTSALATVLNGAHMGRKLCLVSDGAQAGSLGAATLDAAALPHMQAALRALQSARITLDGADIGAEVELFIDLHAPPPRLIVIGAVHTAIPLLTFGNILGFHTIVVDNRTAFATAERMGHAKQLITTWPADALAAMQLDENCHIVFLTHDMKIDNPALLVALRSPARYVGALGSRRTHARRLELLREEGALEEELARIHAPIGLDLGGRSPEEIALAIMAQIVALRHGRDPGR